MTSATDTCAGSPSGRVDQPQTSIVLHPPAVEPGLTEEERRTIAELMAKGSYATIVLGTTDLAGTFDRAQATGAEIVQEPGGPAVRGQGLRDPGPSGQPDPHQPALALKAKHSLGIKFAVASSSGGG